MSRVRASIRGKLIALTLFVILAPISCVLVLVGRNEIRDIRADMVTSSVLITSVVAEYGAAALAFESRTAAEEALQVLAENPRFLDAAIYDRGGKLFASYRHAGATGPAPPAALADGSPRSTVEGDRITVVYPVTQGGERFGTLVLHAATGPLTSRVHAYVWGLWWLTLGIIAATLTLAWALERMVTRRLLTLVDVTRQVARSGDYSRRAIDRRHDEIGLLASAFNNMLVDLQHRQDEAHEAIRLRDEFLSVASHELKTPLTSLKLRVQGMIEHMPAIADPLDAARIHKSVDLAERQVQPVGEAGRQPARRLAHRRRALRAAARRGRPRRAGARRRGPVSPPSWRAGQRGVARAAGARRRPLGSDAPRAGGREPLVERHQVRRRQADRPCTVERAGRRGAIVVRDHGIGIGPRTKRASSSASSARVSLHYGGLGLGLYITREIVRGPRRHHPRRERARRGGRLHRRATAAERHPPGARCHMDAALTPATVMVVDDDIDIRETISDLLELRGFRVIGAGDGADAMAKLKGGARPNVILLDLMMPGLSGEEFRNQQLADAAIAEIPVVLLSGARGVDTAAERMHVASLPKPVELSELMETVGRFCGPGPSSR